MHASPLPASNAVWGRCVATTARTTELTGAGRTDRSQPRLLLSTSGIMNSKMLLSKGGALSFPVQGPVGRTGAGTSSSLLRSRDLDTPGELAELVGDVLALVVISFRIPPGWQ
jgi:hypothetical protein